MATSGNDPSRRPLDEALTSPTTFVFCYAHRPKLVEKCMLERLTDQMRFNTGSNLSPRYLSTASQLSVVWQIAFLIWDGV